ncbi:hypothetical protein Tco_0533287 [Tanacetum coccineum]
MVWIMDEWFAPVARLSNKTLFGQFASVLGFIVYQMDVKGVILYIGNITEEVLGRGAIGYKYSVIKRIEEKSVGTDFKSLQRFLIYMLSKGSLGNLIINLLGFMVSKNSPFHLEAFSDSDYAGDNHDRRSTSGGCQYLGRRLVSWQCKKQTIVAISSTEAEYVAAASCCAQVLWMQNQLLD